MSPWQGHGHLPWSGAERLFGALTTARLVMVELRGVPQLSERAATKSGFRSRQARVESGSSTGGAEKDGGAGALALPCGYRAPEAPPVE